MGQTEVNSPKEIEPDMHHPDAEQSPFNAIPPAVLLLAGVMAGVEIAFQAGEAGFVGGPGSIGWRLEAVRSYGFLDPIWDWMLSNGRAPMDHLIRLLTYPFIHASLTHAAFAVVIVLAIGKSVGEIYSAVSVLLTFFGASIFAAAAYGTVMTTQAPLFGGYPGAYGLIGAFTYLLWIRLEAVGENSMRAFTLIAVLMGLQLIYGIMFGPDPTWFADLMGFVAGFGLAFVVRPGGWTRLLSRLRQR